jgi:hypothetical protein
LLKTFDCEAAGVVDVLEIVVGLVISCQANLFEKAQKIFGIFDFDESGRITYDEMFILIFTSLRAMVRLQVSPGARAKRACASGRERPRPSSAEAGGVRTGGCASEASAKKELCPSAAEAGKRGGWRGRELSERDSFWLARATPSAAEAGPARGCRGETPRP